MENRKKKLKNVGRNFREGLDFASDLAFGKFKEVKSAIGFALAGGEYGRRQAARTTDPALLKAAEEARKAGTLSIIGRTLKTIIRRSLMQE